MKCPKCGHEQANTIECEACGIIFAKYRQAQETQQEMPALRSSGRPVRRRQVPYKLLAVIAAVLVLTAVLLFSGGEEVQQNKPPATSAKEAATDQLAARQAEEEAQYRYYKRLQGYNLDRTLLRFQPGITQEYIDEFNYFWVRAYHCQYSLEIKQDRSRFYEVMRKVMDEALRYRYDYPTKYQYRADVGMKLVDADRREVRLKPYIRVKTNLSGSRDKGVGCAETRNLNTRHHISFAPLKADLQLEIPKRILAALDFPERAFELEADIRFRIEAVSYEHYRRQESFRVKHKAVIEEMDLLNNDNAPRKQRIFMTLRESQLY